MRPGCILCALAFTAVLTGQSADGGATLGVRVALTGPQVDFKATITADGRLMAMTDLSSGDIAVRDMLTGQLKRLGAKSGGWESDDFGDYVTLSPDHRQAVYLWHEGSDAGYLRVMPVTNTDQPGAKPRTLVRNAEFSYILPVAWSTDGKSVLVHIWKKDYTAQLAWVAVRDGSIRVLKSLDWRLRGEPALSSDGNFIAYSALDHANSADSHIYILAADGSSEVEVVKHAGVNSVLSWTPDGKHILFASDRSGSFDLWSVPVDDPGPAALVKTGIGRALPVGITSAGSLFFVHEQGGEDIFLAGFDASTGEASGPVTRLTENSPGINTGPAWSPDGKKIAFKRRNQGNRGGYDLVVRSLESGTEKTYWSSSFAGVPARPIWFKDSRGLLVAMRDRQERVLFQRIDLASGEFSEVLPTDSAYLSVAALSPDEKTIYVLAPDTGKNTSAITAYNLATGEYSQVFSTPGFINNFALSPDGRSLAVARSVATQGRWVGHLSRVEIEGGGVRDLYVPEAGTPEQDVFGGGPMLEWTADGKGILFSTGSRDWKLLWIPAEGGVPAFTGVLTTGLRHDVVSSPDGSRIAFSHGNFSLREIREIDLGTDLTGTKK